MNPVPRGESSPPPTDWQYDAAIAHAPYRQSSKVAAAVRPCDRLSTESAAPYDVMTSSRLSDSFWCDVGPQYQ